MPMERPDFSLVGVGIYTPFEAARLTGARSGQVRRWISGHESGNRSYEPLWSGQLKGVGDSLHLGFKDLVQTRVARAFIDAGLSAQKVRAAIKLGHEIMATDHPLAAAKFQTDGKSVILSILVSGEDDRLIDLFKNGQYLMKKVIEPSLKGVEFEGNSAVRWRPLGESSPIILDPNRQFGQPIDDQSGVPVSVIEKAIKAEGSIEAAAKVLCIKTGAVREASKFWHKMAA
jgi:uncharacterized protein (DUF433 family)